MNEEGKYMFTKSEAMLVDGVAVQSSHAQLDTWLNTASALKSSLGSEKIHRSPFRSERQRSRVVSGVWTQQRPGEQMTNSGYATKSVPPAPSSRSKEITGNFETLLCCGSGIRGLENIMFLKCLTPHHSLLLPWLLPALFSPDSYRTSCLATGKTTRHDVREAFSCITSRQSDVWR